MRMTVTATRIRRLLPRTTDFAARRAFGGEYAEQFEFLRPCRSMLGLDVAVDAFRGDRAFLGAVECR